MAFDFKDGAFSLDLAYDLMCEKYESISSWTRVGPFGLQSITEYISVSFLFSLKICFLDLILLWLLDSAFG